MFHDNEIRGQAEDRLHKHYRTDHLRRARRPALAVAPASHARRTSPGATPLRAIQETPLQASRVDDPRWSTETIDDYDRDVERPGEVATIVSVLAFLALIAILA